MLPPFFIYMILSYFLAIACVSISVDETLDQGIFPSFEVDNLSILVHTIFLFFIFPLMLGGVRKCLKIIVVTVAGAFQKVWIQ